jgi:Protein of unknown function (DUF2505)
MIGAMDIRTEVAFAGATPDQVFALFVDPDFQAAVCEAQHALDYHVSIEEHDDGGADIAVNRTMPAEVPDFAKKFVGETLDIRQVESWGGPDASGRRVADVNLEVLTQPVKMSGTLALESDGSGVTQFLDSAVKVSIPFLGSKLEAEFAKAIVLGLRQQAKTGSEWLAGT